GQMPVNEMQYRQFIAYVKRFGHLAEHGSHNIMNPAQSPGVFHTEQTFMTNEFGTPGQPSAMWPTGVFNAGSATAPEGTYLYDGDDSDTTDDDGEANAVLFQREDDEPDMSQWSNNDQAEFYYQKYKRYRKKWRRFVGK
ncbi:unnamed protein product, partial [Prorocentrum cordatum]